MEQPETCRSCNSDMELSESGEYWVCPYCQGEPGSIRRVKDE